MPNYACDDNPMGLEKHKLNAEVGAGYFLYRATPNAFPLMVFLSFCFCDQLRSVMCPVLIAMGNIWTKQRLPSQLP